jgi:AcrR family transcriptional regulator
MAVHNFARSCYTCGVETKTERAELTLAAIVDLALDMALRGGLESLSLGELAKRLELSKSGVFSRVGSREALQLEVIAEYDRRFLAAVFTPATREPRGLPRLRALMDRWLRRATDEARGCLYCAGAFEYDHQEGVVRARLLDGVTRWRGALRRTIQQALDEGHLRVGTDPEQLVFEMDALFTGVTRDLRFLRDRQAPARARASWDRLLSAHIA